MRFKIAVTVVTLSLAASLLTRASLAETITFKSAAPGGIYPYEMSINGSATDTIMDCLSDNRTVTTNETWYVNATDLQGFSGTINGATSTELDEDAFLDSKYNTSFAGADNAEIQDAIWDVENPNSVSGLNSSERSEVTTLLSDATYFVGLNSDTSAFYSQFTLYTPTTNEWGWTRGQPQQFLQYTPTPTITPEPSSLLLLGTGIIGAAGLMRRRMVASSTNV